MLNVKKVKCYIKQLNERWNGTEPNPFKSLQKTYIDDEDITASAEFPLSDANRYLEALGYPDLIFRCRSIIRRRTLDRYVYTDSPFITQFAVLITAIGYASDADIKELAARLEKSLSKYDSNGDRVTSDNNDNESDATVGDDTDDENTSLEDQIAETIRVESLRSKSTHLDNRLSKMGYPDLRMKYLAAIGMGPTEDNMVKNTPTQRALIAQYENLVEHAYDESDTFDRLVSEFVKAVEIINNIRPIVEMSLKLKELQEKLPKYINDNDERTIPTILEIRKLENKIKTLMDSMETDIKPNVTTYNKDDIRFYHPRDQD